MCALFDSWGELAIPRRFTDSYRQRSHRAYLACLHTLSFKMFNRWQSFQTTASHMQHLHIITRVEEPRLDPLQL